MKRFAAGLLVSAVLAGALYASGENNFAQWAAGLMAPTTADAGRFLKADGTWQAPTGNDFFVVSGPGTSAKTFTFPNASSTVLTSNAAVTVAQGGTGAAPGADDQVLVADSTTAATWRTLTDCQGTGKAVIYTAATNTWGCNTITSNGSDPWTYLSVNGGSDFTTSSGTAVDVTGLTLTPSANTNYEIECSLLMRTATATVNPRIGIVWSTGLTDGMANIVESQSATTALSLYGSTAATMLSAVGGLTDTTNSWPALVKISMRAGSSPSGATKIQLASETAGTNVTLKGLGGFCKWRTN